MERLEDPTATTLELLAVETVQVSDWALASDLG
jgi:hypothetical protein